MDGYLFFLIWLAVYLIIGRVIARRVVSARASRYQSRLRLVTAAWPVLLALKVLSRP